MNLHACSEFLSRRFAFVLALAFLVGLICPAIDRAPSELLTFVLALQIFFACFKIDLKDLHSCPLKTVLLFYVLRFLLLPIVAYPIIAAITPTYTAAIFLLLLLPAGTASPAYCAMFKGNVALSIMLLVISSLAAPVVIPAAFQLIAGARLEIDTGAMLVTLVLMIFCPLLLHIPIRKFERVSAFIRSHNALLVVPFSATTLLLSLAMRRDMIFAAPWSSFGLVIIALSIYLALYLGAWRTMLFQPSANRISFALSSTLNNVTLGLVLALVHLDRSASLFLVAASVAWALMLIPAQLWSHSKSEDSRV